MKASLITPGGGLVHFSTRIPRSAAIRMGLPEDGCIYGRWQIGTDKILLTRTGAGPSLDRNWHEPLTTEAVAEVEAPIWTAIDEMIENEPALKKLVQSEAG